MDSKERVFFDGCLMYVVRHTCNMYKLYIVQPSGRVCGMREYATYRDARSAITCEAIAPVHEIKYYIYPFCA